MKIERSVLVDIWKGFIVFLLLFSSIAFYQTSKGNLHVLIMLFVVGTTTVSVFLNPAKLRFVFQKLPTATYFYWFVILFGLIGLHYFFVGHSSPIPKIDIFSQFLIVILIIFLFCDVEIIKATKIFAFAGCLSSLALVFYLFLMGYLQQFLFQTQIETTRFGSDTEDIRNINYVTFSVVLFTAYSIYSLIFQKKYRLFFVIFSVVQISVLLLSGSKKTVISLLFMLIIFLYFKNRNRLYIYVLLSSIVLLLAYYFLMNNAILYNSVGYRLEAMMYLFFGFGNSVDNRLLSSDSVRENLLIRALSISKETPIWGNGFAYFQVHSGLNSTYHTYHTHNNYLEIYINYGLIGFVYYYSMYVRSFFLMIRTKNKELLYFFIAFFIILFLVLEPTIVSFYISPIVYLFLYFAYRYAKANNNLCLTG